MNNISPVRFGWTLTTPETSGPLFNFVQKIANTLEGGKQQRPANYGVQDKDAFVLKPGKEDRAELFRTNGDKTAGRPLWDPKMTSLAKADDGVFEVFYATMSNILKPAKK